MTDDNELLAQIEALEEKLAQARASNQSAFYWSAASGRPVPIGLALWRSWPVGGTAGIG